MRHAELFAKSVLPTEDDDDWRYGRINDLELSRFHPLESVAATSFLDPALLELVRDPAVVVRTLNGRIESIERSGELGDEVVVGSGTTMERPAGFSSLVEEAPDAFSHLAEALVDDVTVVMVPRATRVQAPIVIAHVIGAEEKNAAIFPRTFVSLAESAEASVIEVFVSGEAELLVTPISELIVGENAHLSYTAVQELGRASWQLGYQLSRVERAGKLKSFAAALGGDYARLCTRSSLVGEGAESELLAVYFGDRDQVEDFRTFQDHVAPRTRSNLVFKGAVTDSAHSVYTGLIHMTRGAKKADAAQTNRNLVLSKGAHADSVPNLDIDENDVRCSHASAVGPIDREQIFYLESKGVRPEVAERLLLLGFFDELLGALDEPACAAYLREAIGARLSLSFGDLVATTSKEG